MTESRSPNRLVHEKSPYLLQHAYNPVDWYPWGDEAFDKARQEDKPVFLSIGYSTCHWCHVMEHESFEDPQVAALMNDAFVSIKVDREERPDIDNIYMAVCQMLTGSGGWPLTILLTPDRRPFFATTYIPKESRFGRAGMLDLVPQLHDVWQKRRTDVLASAEQITSALQEARSDAAADEPSTPDIDRGMEQLSQRFDTLHAGFGNSPKFPTPHQLLFLLRYWKRTGHPRALEMSEKTLRAMRLGGIYDQLGFGLHRYSTDRKWLVPHFEKMLYDQALLAMACTEAFQASGKPEYRETATEIFTYVLRDMTSPQGGFYSAEDADSEGEEGKFYVWAAEELREALGPEDARFVISLFNVSEAGNFIDSVTQEYPGTNILHLDEMYYRLTEQEKQKMNALRGKLFALREQRVHPYKDDKILTDWNGLMIAALARAARAFEAPEYADAAARAAEFLLSMMRNPDGSLKHRYRDGEAGLPAHVDDYAFVICGLIDLYQATFNTDWLAAALDLNRYLLEHFWDAQQGGFFFTSDAGEPLLVRTKEVYDGAVPSGNSVAFWNLLRLSRMTGDVSLEQKASQLARAFSTQVKSIPFAHSQFLIAVDFAAGPAFEVVIAGSRESEDTKALLAALNRSYLPNHVLLFRSSDEKEAARLIALAPFTKNQSALDGRATAYVCRGGQCDAPVQDPEAMLRLLNA